MLEHMVDTVLYFEGDRNVSYPSQRKTVWTTMKIGVFEMGEEGLAGEKILRDIC